MSRRRIVTNGEMRAQKMLEVRPRRVPALPWVSRCAALSSWASGQLTMTSQSPQFALALTHVFKGVARFTISNAAQRNAAQQAPGRAARRLNEGKRRTRVLEGLYQEHTVCTVGPDSELHSVQTLPPESWINTKLSAMGEPWRVHNVDGFGCEIYDVS